MTYISFYVIDELGHVHLIKDGQQVFVNFPLDGM